MSNDDKLPKYKLRRKCGVGTQLLGHHHEMLQAGIVYDLGLPTCVFHADELDRFQPRKACDSNARNATARMQVNRTEPTWFCIPVVWARMRLWRVAKRAVRRDHERSTIPRETGGREARLARRGRRLQVLQAVLCGVRPGWHLTKALAFAKVVSCLLGIAVAVLLCVR